MLTDITIQNYRSLRNVQLPRLPQFSVLVGANASGKSNFADSLDFLSLVFRDGLAAAVRAKGGYENICWRRVRRSKAQIQFGLKASASAGWLKETPFAFEYNFGFKTKTEAIGAEYYVTHEYFAVRRAESTRPLLEIRRTEDEDVQLHLSSEGATELGLPEEDFLREYIQRPSIPVDELLVAAKLGPLGITSLMANYFSGCRVYQIAPHTAREPGIPERSPEMGKRGENLPAAIAYMKRNEPDAFLELFSHLKYAVSTMDSLETGYLETNELGLFFKERGVGRKWYALEVSDGTLKTVGMFLPLFDPRVTIAVIEEPENSIHPWVLRHFIEVCKTRAAEKQIFLTTHSPVALDGVPIESLFVVRRREGETGIDRLETLYPDARQVIEEELFGLGEFWDRGAIGGVPEVDSDGASG